MHIDKNWPEKIGVKPMQELFHKAVHGDEEALKRCHALAEQGNVEAQYTLGHMYYEGIGVEQNYLEAAKYYALSAEQGSADAQYILGIMFDRGLGVSQNYEKASIFYQLAANQGFSEAQYNVTVK